MKALQTILGAIISEKATQMSENKTYTFLISPRATKIDVKHAIKELYGEDVDSVRIVVTPEKTRMMRRTLVNKRSRTKKAFVTLKDRKKLDVTKLKDTTKK